MKTFKLHPSPAMCPFIDRLWGWEGTAGEIVQLPTLLPGTGAELYFHYGEPFRYTVDGNHQTSSGPGHLFCVRHKTIQLSSSTNIGFIAVRFKIGMIHRFTKIPGKEMLDRILSIEEVWGGSGSELLRHLSYASDMNERIFLIQSFLMNHLKNESLDPVIEKAMPILYRQCSSISIQILAEKLHLSRRQLERRFMAFSGQSPNEVKCLSRFQHTIRKLMLDSSENPMRVALANGYYDQAHFIHDFQNRVGNTPHQYLQNACVKTHFYNTTC
ncbi:MAG: AraC family transcriptional regulator [Glaciimonas sp.]|nr:AraC family transcriptional regulator [Glaciimonas sp.]